MKESGVKESITGEQYLFELAGYLVTCAEMALSPRGSPRYSALRFVEVVKRLVDLPRYVHSLKEDPFLTQISKKFQNLKIEQDQTEQLRTQLQEILLDFADEGARRIRK